MRLFVKQFKQHIVATIFNSPLFDDLSLSVEQDIATIENKAIKISPNTLIMKPPSLNL